MKPVLCPCCACRLSAEARFCSQCFVPQTDALGRVPQHDLASMFDRLIAGFQPPLQWTRYEHAQPDVRVFHHLIEMDSYLVRFARYGGDLREILFDGRKYLVFGVDETGFFLLREDDGRVHFLSAPSGDQPQECHLLNCSLRNFLRCYARFAASILEKRSTQQLFAFIDYVSLHEYIEKQADLPQEGDRTANTIVRGGQDFVRHIEGSLTPGWERLWFLLDEDGIRADMTSSEFLRDGLMSLEEIGISRPDNGG